MVCLFVVFHRKDIKSLFLCVRRGACFRLLIVEPGDIRRMARTALISKNVYLQMLGQTQFLNIAQIQRQRDD